MTTKIILTAIIGVFMGAFAYELFNGKRRPHLVSDAQSAVSDFRKAFLAGYSGEIPEA